jgi:hypothetical protein
LAGTRKCGQNGHNRPNAFQSSLRRAADVTASQLDALGNRANQPGFLFQGTRADFVAYILKSHERLF